DRGRHPLAGFEQRSDEVGREVGEGGEVLAGYEQDMAGEDRPLVQEGQRQLLVQHQVGRDLPIPDLAEDTGVSVGHGGGTICVSCASMPAMADESSVPLSSGLPETVLPAPPPEVASALSASLAQPDANERRAAVARVAAA